MFLCFLPAFGSNTEQPLLLPNGEVGQFHSCDFSWVSFKTQRGINVFEWNSLPQTTQVEISSKQDYFKIVDQKFVTVGTNRITRSIITKKEPDGVTINFVMSDKKCDFGSGGNSEEHSAKPYFIDENTIALFSNTCVVAFRDMNLDGKSEAIVLRKFWRKYSCKKIDDDGTVHETEIYPWSSSFISDGNTYSYYLLSTNQIPSVPIRKIDKPDSLKFENQEYSISNLVYKYEPNLPLHNQIEKIPCLGNWSKIPNQRVDLTVKTPVD